MTATALQLQTVYPFARITNKSPCVKEYGLQDGRAQKVGDKQATIYDATVKVEHLTFDALARALTGLTQHDCLSYATPQHEAARLVVNRERERYTAGLDENGLPVVARTKAFFSFRAGLGIWALDFDDLTDEQEAYRRYAVCEQVMPELAGAEKIFYPSGSTYLYNGESGECLRGCTGLRVLVGVDDATRIPELHDYLLAELHQNNHGWAIASANGSVLARAPLDSSTPENRLDYIAGASLLPPLVQRRPAPTVAPGVPLCTARVLGPTPQPDVYRKMRKDAEARTKEASGLMGEARRKKAVAISQRAEQIARARGTNSAAETARVRREVTRIFETCTLTRDFVLHLSATKTISIGEILSDPENWSNIRVCDPFEPEYRDWSLCAELYVDEDEMSGRPVVTVCSFAHGANITYRLLWTFRDPGAPKAKVYWSEHDAGRAYDEAADAMLDYFADHELYRGGEQIFFHGEKISTESLLHRVLPQATELWAFYRPKNAEEGEYDEKRCPLTVLRAAALADTLLPRLPQVIADTQRPLLKNGHLCNTPGVYNGVRLHAPVLSALPREEDVTLDAARTAYAALAHNFASFTFEQLEGQAIAVAMAMTALLGASIGPRPAVQAVGHNSQAGKTTVLKIASMLGGAPADLISLSEKDDKSLLDKMSVVMPKLAGSLVFDNVRQGATISSDVIAQLITEGKLTGRQSGTGKFFTAGIPGFVGFSGKNYSMAEDLHSRVIPLQLGDPPADRKPLSEDWFTTLGSPADLWNLCVLVAYGCKTTAPREWAFCRFDLWSQVVRGTLYDVTGLDVWRATELHAEAAIDSEEANLLAALHTAYGTDPFTVPEAWQLASQPKMANQFAQHATQRPVRDSDPLRAALRVFMSSNGLAYRLRGIVGQQHGPYKLQAKTAGARRKLYSVEFCEDEE